MVASQRVRAPRSLNSRAASGAGARRQGAGSVPCHMADRSRPVEAPGTRESWAPAVVPPLAAEAIAARVPARRGSTAHAAALVRLAAKHLIRPGCRKAPAHRAIAFGAEGRPEGCPLSADVLVRNLCRGFSATGWGDLRIGRRVRLPTEASAHPTSTTLRSGDPPAQLIAGDRMLDRQPVLERRTQSHAPCRFTLSRRRAIASDTRSPCRYIISISRWSRVPCLALLAPSSRRSISLALRKSLSRSCASVVCAAGRLASALSPFRRLAMCFSPSKCPASMGGQDSTLSPIDTFWRKCGSQGCSMPSTHCQHQVWPIRPTSGITQTRVHPSDLVPRLPGPPVLAVPTVNKCNAGNSASRRSHPCWR